MIFPTSVVIERALPNSIRAQRQKSKGLREATSPVLKGSGVSAMQACLSPPTNKSRLNLLPLKNVYHSLTPGNTPLERMESLPDSRQKQQQQQEQRCETLQFSNMKSEGLGPIVQEQGSSNFSPQNELLSQEYPESNHTANRLLQRQSLQAVPATQKRQRLIPSEFDEAVYLAEVLHLKPHVSESEALSQLRNEAQLLGLPLELIDKGLPSSGTWADMTSGLRPAQYRLSLASSQWSACTYLSQSTASSHSTAVSSIAETPVNTLERRDQNEVLDISIYSAYLMQLNPAIFEPCPPSLVSRKKRSNSLRISSTAPLKVKNLKHRMQRKPKQDDRREDGSVISVLRDAASRLVVDPGIIENRAICGHCDKVPEPDDTEPLHILPCGHAYCSPCLREIVILAVTNEQHMPPHCCSQPFSDGIIKAVLTSDQLQMFLMALLRINFITLPKQQVICPNTICGERVSPEELMALKKHSFGLQCRHCDQKICIVCKFGVHKPRLDCPGDRILTSVKKTGYWQRCSWCGSLVEQVESSRYFTCRCEARFCSSCKATWDPIIGCPNLCREVAALESSRINSLCEKQAECNQISRAEADAQEILLAEQRTLASTKLVDITKGQDEEMSRFVEYEKTFRRRVRLRQVNEKKELVDQHYDLMEKMMDRHAELVSQLEDRQIVEEMELREMLDKRERSVLTRLKHMEAYCGSINASNGSNIGDMVCSQPPRVITEGERRELLQQYYTRDNMERLHQARINVLRCKQAKRTEKLLAQHEVELKSLAHKHDENLSALAAERAVEDGILDRFFEVRKYALQRRWLLVLEIARAKIEAATGSLLLTPRLPEWRAAQVVAEPKAVMWHR